MRTSQGSMTWWRRVKNNMFLTNEILQRNTFLALKLTKAQVTPEVSRNELMRQKMYVLKDEKAFKNEDKKMSYTDTVEKIIRVLGRRQESRTKG